MKSAEFFGYQIGDDGHLILPGLTAEETLEFELLSRRDAQPQDRQNEMRALELYLKQHNARSAPKPQSAASAKSPPASVLPKPVDLELAFRPDVFQHELSRQYPAPSPSRGRGDLGFAATVGLMGALLVALIFIAVNL